MLEDGLEARVLVCDPDNQIFPTLAQIMHERFSEGEPPSVESLEIMRNSKRFEIGKVGLVFADTLKEVVEEVKRTSNPGDPPYYSLVVYESHQMLLSDGSPKDGSAGNISKVRKQDSFLPQMIAGKGTTIPLAGQYSRAGALHIAPESDDVRHEIKQIFRRSEVLPDLTVVKIGGSAFDFDDSPGGPNLENVCNTFSQIHAEKRGTTKKREMKRILVTVGAGRYGDVDKTWLRNHGHLDRVQSQYPPSIAISLEKNTEQLKTLFGGVAALITSGAFYYIGKNLTGGRIPLIGIAPHYIMARDGIPLQDSDTHTVALAEFYGAERVVIVKRTDGIYDFDPYKGRPLNVNLSQDNPENEELIYKWMQAQKNNKRYGEVTVRDMLNGNISRIGTNLEGDFDGSTGHLMEDSALEYFTRCKHVKEILIVHIAPEEMHYPIGGNEYKHIVTGETVTVDPKIGWDGILEKNVKSAFKGMAYSKIVRAN